jgi:hypothetical protein
MESSASSPVPTSTCSPDSSTRVRARRYDFVSARSPASTFGSSEGLRGSTDTFMHAVVLKDTGRKGATSPAPPPPTPVTVAERATASPRPSSSTRLPGGAESSSMR